MSIQSVSLYNRLVRPTSITGELPVLLGFNLILVALSYASIILPFSPVPITGQTLGLLLVAMTLGRVRSMAVVAAYLAEGALGLPVFAGGSAGIGTFFGPTGGYLAGFLVAAYVVGLLADRGWDCGYLRVLSAMVAGTALIFACGLVQLSFFVPDGSLLTLGLNPFVPGAVIKISIATLLLAPISRRVGRMRK